MEPAGGSLISQDQAQEAVARLAGGVAHDFNNILLALRTYGELALRRLDAGKDARDEVREMLDAADRAAALTRRLLAFSGRHVVRPVEVDVNEIVLGLEQRLSAMLPDDVELELLPSSIPARVRADAGLLEEALAIVAANAVEAMPAGGSLAVTVAIDRQAVTIGVVDTGIGMDPATAARAFEPFFTTRESGGGGLGLSAAHGIVRQNGGAITLESELGRGTTVRIALPLVETDPDEATPPAPADGALVLLVEDDDVVRRSIGRVLEEEGFEVVGAASGAEAMRLAETRRPAVVVTDVVLAGMNGRETVEHIRARHADMPVVYMSGYTDDAALRSQLSDAWTTFLQKPFPADDLLQAIYEALSAGPSGHD